MLDRGGGFDKVKGKEACGIPAALFEAVAKEAVKTDKNPKENYSLVFS